MTKLKWFSASIVIGLCLLVGWCSMPTAHYRYRLTVEIDTPEGVKSASAVHEVTWDYAYGAVTSFIARMRGEAIFVDLGPGTDGKPRHVIALMPFETLVPETFDNRFNRPQYQSYATLPGVHEARDQRQITLVNFADINDPATARIVHGRTLRYEQRDGGQVAIHEDVREMARIFGPGYAFRRATLEMVPAGWWPFNRWDGGWPQWLFGEPLTRGIEQRLPWWNGPFPWLKQLGPGSTTYVDTRPNDQYRLSKEQFRRNF
ncbi:MAG: hypothetical protein IOC90_07615 [Methylocystis sp.]|nr:hypothetical protein [Methylocystis sp.]MCA3587885.1 hypothetical protein [Methylocystis sp.]MCA3592937.1 hypothetical protein [Methylocystis sp.]